jgi:dienelactone hydrolase
MKSVAVIWNNYAGLFKITSLMLSAMLLMNISLAAQHKLDVISGWIHFSDASNSLYHDLADKAYRALDRRDSVVAALNTLSDWRRRQKTVRQTLANIVGPLPEKTPLNARITKTINKDDYSIEDIIYESQPGLYVTSSLFIPAGLKNRAPAIIYCSGHSDEGYRYPVYQHTILNLVKKGFIVFAFDPVDQGERGEYYDTITGASEIGYRDPATGKYITGAPDTDHSYSGAQAFIIGGSQARFMIWDGIRAVDYLLTRKEVDPARIGITGRSGGGTQSAYIAAFDNRIYAAAPECYITNFTRLIQSIGPQDAEQDLYHGIANGIDHADFLAVRAPKPALMITTTRDMFSIQGARETAAEVSRIYSAYGKKDNFRMVADDAPHASTRKNRESMYAFFQKYLNNPGDSDDRKVKLLSNKELLVSSTGRASGSPGAKTFFDLDSAEAKKLIHQITISRKDIPRHLSVVVNSAERLSGYREPGVYHKPVFTGRFQKDGYVIEKYFVKGEGDYIIPYLLLVPDNANHKAIICLDSGGKSDKDSVGKAAEWFARKGYTVMAPDLIGTGETGPGGFRGDSYIGGVSYNVWFLSILVGRSIVGIRAANVARLAELLKRNNGIKEIYGLAIKEVTPVLLYAAAFDTAISRIALIDPCLSYKSIVMNRFYNPALLYNAVAGALKAYDLPGLAASLSPRKLLIVRMTDDNDSCEEAGYDPGDISFIKAAYHYMGADKEVRIINKKPTEGPNSVFRDWIE